MKRTVVFGLVRAVKNVCPSSLIPCDRYAQGRSERSPGWPSKPLYGESLEVRPTAGGIWLGGGRSYLRCLRAASECRAVLRSVKQVKAPEWEPLRSLRRVKYSYYVPRAKSKKLFICPSMYPSLSRRRTLPWNEGDMAKKSSISLLAFLNM